MRGPCGLLCTPCVINLMLSLLSDTLVCFYVTDFHATDRHDEAPAVKKNFWVDLFTCTHGLLGRAIM